MTRDQKIKKDGLFSCLGGQDSGQSASVIGPDQYALGVNVTARGGFLTNRPGFDQIGLTFDNNEQTDWFRTHRIEGCKTYYGKGGRNLNIVSVSGRIFTVDPLDHFMVTEITPTMATATASNFTVPAGTTTVDVDVDDASLIFEGYPIVIGGKLYMVVSKFGNTLTITNINDTVAALITSPQPVIYLDPNDPTENIVWMEQADQWMVIQDGLDAPIIYDGASARRTDVTKEVPTGTAMVFNEEIQRLCVATIDNRIVIGDIATGPTSAIAFTENIYLAEGGAFQIPFKFGQVTGMTMMANPDRSNGQGAMLVFAKRGISAFNLPPNRSLWKDLMNPVQINIAIKYSATGQYGIVTVNGDVFYVAPDGLRSFAYVIRQFSTWSTRSQSREMTRVLKKNTKRLLKFSSGILFDNRLIWTVNPLPSENGVFHRSMGVLDFDLTSSLRGDAPAAYDGSWTGFKPVLLWTGEFDEEERAFAYALNSEGHNELWEISRENPFDNQTVRIEASIETRSMSFGDPREMKRMLACELWDADVRGLVTFDLKWKPDQHPCWFDWAARSICATYFDCEEDPLVCKTIKAFQPGYRTRIGFGTPPDASDPGDRKPARCGYEFSIRLAWTGKVEIRKMLVKCQEVDELEFGDNSTAIPALVQTTTSTAQSLSPCEVECPQGDIDGGTPSTPTP